MVKHYFDNLRSLPSRLNLQGSGKKLAEMAKSQFYQVVNETKGIREKLKDLAKTNYDLGMYHMREGNLYDAGLRFGMVVFLRPDHYWAHYQQGRTLLARDKQAEGIQCLQKALKIKPDFLEAQYMMATVDTSYTPKVIPLSIIEEHFDQLAKRYNDLYLIERNYRGHIQLIDALKTVAGTEFCTHNKDALDLGCGTGLAGRALREQLQISRFVGVDISKRMLDEARELRIDNRPVYQLFHAADIIAYLTACQEQYDVVIASLSFNYSGDLLPTLLGIKKVLRPGGFVAFSVEKSEQDGFQLAPDLTHFVHSRAAITQALAGAGLQERSCEEATLYAGSTGYLVVAAA